jgi:hypothetical protein
MCTYVTIMDKFQILTLQVKRKKIEVMELFVKASKG